jgi:hypothetical protein
VWLGRSAPNPLDRTLLLAIANLGLACVLFVPQFRGGSLLLNGTTTGALLGWSIAYSITYGAFVRWPELISVWGLLAAQAGILLARLMLVMVDIVLAGDPLGWRLPAI